MNITGFCYIYQSEIVSLLDDIKSQEMLTLPQNFLNLKMLKLSIIVS